MGGIFGGAGYGGGEGCGGEVSIRQYISKDKRQPYFPGRISDGLQILRLGACGCSGNHREL